MYLVLVLLECAEVSEYCSECMGVDTSGSQRPGGRLKS